MEDLEKHITENSVIIIDIKDSDLQCKLLKAVPFNDRLLAAICNLICDTISKYVDEDRRKEFEDRVVILIKEMVEKRHDL